MKKILLSHFSLILVHIIASACNFACAVSGGSYKLYNLAVTLLYIAYWCVFIAKGKHSKTGIAVYSVIFAISVVGTVVAKFALIADWLIPFVLLLLPPFVGLGVLLRSWHWWIAMVVISVFMTVFSIINYKQRKSADA